MYRSVIYIIVICCSGLHGGVSENMHTLETVAMSCFAIVCLLFIADGELSLCWKCHSILILCSSSFDLKCQKLKSNNPELLVQSSPTTKHAENTTPSSFNYLTSAFIALVPPCPHFIWLGLRIFVSHVERVSRGSLSVAVVVLKITAFFFFFWVGPP